MTPDPKTSTILIQIHGRMHWQFIDDFEKDKNPKCMLQRIFHFDFTYECTILYLKKQICTNVTRYTTACNVLYGPETILTWDPHRFVHNETSWACNTYELEHKYLSTICDRVHFCKCMQQILTNGSACNNNFPKNRSVCNSNFPKNVRVPNLSIIGKDEFHNNQHNHNTTIIKESGSHRVLE